MLLIVGSILIGIMVMLGKMNTGETGGFSGCLFILGLLFLLAVCAVGAILGLMMGGM